MRIDRLELRNYRSFEDRAFDFHPRFNVIIGTNGAGKTAVLDALAIGIGSFFLGLDEPPARQINKADARLVVHEHEGVPDLQPQFPTEIRCRGTVGEAQETISWSRELNGVKGKTTRQNAQDLQRHAERLQQEVRHGKPTPLPVLGYYGTGRLWVFKRDKRGTESNGGHNRFGGYDDCLDPASDHKGLVRWMKRQAMVAAQRGRALSQIDAVEKAVLGCVGAGRRLYYDLLHDELRLDLDDGRTFPFSILSDGYRNMVAMVADIAWRAAKLNPQHGAEAAAKATGVVLIDELDLHLHPQWQRRVIQDLRRVFPQLQFVTTTHSPFIIQSLHDGWLINLDSQGKVPWSDQSIEDITEDVMGVELPQRSLRHEQMVAAAEEYYRKLAELRDPAHPDLQALKLRLDELVEPFSDDPAFTTFLRMERRAAEAERAQHEAG